MAHSAPQIELRREGHFKYQLPVYVLVLRASFEGMFLNLSQLVSALVNLRREIKA